MKDNPVNIKNSQTFCAAPWVNLTVSIGGNMSPCCEISGEFGNTKHQPIKDLWNGGLFLKLREAFISGNKPKACWKCYEVDACGGKSMRQQYNEKFNNHIELISPLKHTAPLPISLDIRFSNICNFSCRMCWHGSSSHWYQDAKALRLTNSKTALIKSFSTKDNGVKEISALLPGVKYLYWAGGEPLITREHYAILEDLIAKHSTDIYLKYNTNFSKLTYDHGDIFKLWEQFKNIELVISIDGIKDRGELIRHGFSWDIFLSNLKLIKQKCPHIKIKFGITVSVFNVFVLDELHQNLLDLEVCHEDDFEIHCLQEPNFYRVNILPKKLKEEVTVKLKDYINTLKDSPGRNHASVVSQLGHVIVFLKAKGDFGARYRFSYLTLKLDARRNQNTSAVCPELKSFIYGAFKLNLILNIIYFWAKKFKSRMISFSYALKKKGGD